MSYAQMKQQNLSATTISGYIAYQMKRVQQGQEPIDSSDAWTWALGEFTDGNGGACAPLVDWYPVRGQVRVDWSGVGGSDASLGVRSPVG